MLKQTSREIDALRGAGALGVIWGHSIYFPNMPIELNGAFWVWIFFSLSGFFIGGMYIDGSNKFTLKDQLAFLWNRALRILPLYYIALILGLVFELAASTDEAVSLSVIRQFLFISPLNSTTLSGPLWSIAAIVKFYIVSLFIVMLIAKVKPERKNIIGSSGSSQGSVLLS